MKLSDSFFKITPWDHQRKAVEETVDLEGYGFFFEVGAGKTMTCINALRVKYCKAGRLLKTLILAPPIVLENWKKEFAMHSNIHAKNIVILYGTTKKRIEMMKKLEGKDCIILTNYESLNLGVKRDKAGKKIPGELFKLLYDWQPEALVLDESHRCKDIRAGRTEYAIKLADRAYYKFLLTGTPFLNAMWDYFAQFRILDGGKTFGRQYFAFRNKYFADKNAGMSKQSYFPNWQPKRGAADEIGRLVRRKSMFVEKVECLDLPPLVKSTIEVKMGPKQEKAYEEMRAQLISYIESEEAKHQFSPESGGATTKAAVAEYAMTKALRLQQIVSGFVNVEEGGGTRAAHKFTDSVRVKALKEILTDVAPHHKVLVWAVFKDNYEDIAQVCKNLKLDYVEVHGGVSQKRKMDAVDRLNNDPNCRVLIGHPGSGGIGINLVAASYSIFYSRGFSLEYDIQAEARNYRGGSERHAKVTRVDFVTPGTIDEQVLKALASKKKLSYEILKHELRGG